VLLLAGEHRAGAAEAGRDLVADEKDVVPIAEAAHLAQVSARRKPYAGRTLHERLDHDRGDLVVSLGERSRERLRVAHGHPV